jgi:hypothetical protein
MPPREVLYCHFDSKEDLGLPIGNLAQQEFGASIKKGRGFNPHP